MTTSLITGASSGAGAATARHLAALGHRVIAVGRDGARLDEIAQTEGIEAVQMDITDRAALQDLANRYTVDLLVNNAGMMPALSPVIEAAQDDLDQVIAVNFSAQVALTKAIAKGMAQRGSGHVIFVGSTAGHAPFASIATYGATKAALGSFAQALRLELGDQGVRVTELVAGRIETALYKDILPDEVRASMYAGGTALQPEDIAEAVAFAFSLPPRACVARLDIVPTRQSPVGSGKTK